MRVLHINQNYTGHLLHGELLSELTRQGVENTLFCPERIGARLVDDKVMKIIPMLRLAHKVSLWAKCRAIKREVEKRIDVRSYDLIHAYTIFADGVVAYQLSKEYHIPYVVAVRQSDLNFHLKYRPWLWPLARRVMSNAKSVFFLSDPYRKRMYPNGENVQTIPSGLTGFWVDNPPNLARVNDGIIRIASVGTMDRNKNIISVAKAARLLVERGHKVTLEIASSSEDPVVLGEVMKFPFVQYHGKLNAEGVRDLFRRCDLFALVSYQETFGTVYTEAMSQGLPLVYTKDQGFDGCFADGEVGYASMPDDISAIAEAIQKCYNNRSQLSSNALRGVKRFSWTIIAGRYKEIYENT